MAEIILNAKDAVLGRLGSFAAKQLLRGNSVTIINSEEVIISGDKKVFKEKLLAKMRMGQGASLKGPKYSKRADLLLKRIIRGMLPWDRPKGRNAHERLRCYIGDNHKFAKEAKIVEHNKPQRFFKLKDMLEELR